MLNVTTLEIRTPLTGIMGSIGLLQSMQFNQEQLDLLKISHICGEQLLVAINDILGTSIIHKTLPLNPN